MLKNKISDFNPDLNKVNTIYKKRIIKYLYAIIFFLLLEITSLLIAFYIEGSDTLKILSLILTIFGLLNLMTFAWIIDFGVASKIKKANFKIKGINSKNQGHTYYYAIIKIGITRILINLIIIIIPIIFAMISFTI